MNAKTEQNSQKGTKGLDTHNYSKQATGKLMDNILSNVKTHIRRPHQNSSNGVGAGAGGGAAAGMSLPAQSKLEPEYLNNILIDINDANRFKNKHKLNGLTKTPDRSPARRPNTSDESAKSALKSANAVNSLLGKTEKRPKSSIKRRLKKLIESNKKNSTEDGAHSSKQQTKTSKKEATTTHVQIAKEETSNNVQQISNPEQSIINNTPTSIAESDKREPKHKKTKKEYKKRELREKSSSGNNKGSAEHSSDPLEIDKKTTKYKPKAKPNKKNASITSCPPSILTNNSTQSQQSKKIKLLVNQIASNLKQSTRFELNTGNIKRDIYIKGLSTCMTSQALDQINRILNPPRVAAYRAAVKNTKTTSNNSNNNNNNQLKPNNAQNEETSRPTTSQKDKIQISKINIANEINTFNKPPPSLSPPSLSPPQSASPVPPLEHEVAENRVRDFIQIQAHAQKEKAAADKTQNPEAVDEKLLINITPPMTNQEQELIKKINEKIDKIISSGLSSCDTVDTSSSSLNTSPDEGKNVPQPPQPPPPIPFLPPAKPSEPPKFMQAPANKPHVSKINASTTTTQTPANTTTKLVNREPRANESPPLQPQPHSDQPHQPHIKNIINVIRNSEIVNEIKLNTITVLQNAVSKSASNAQQTLTEKPVNSNNPKAVEKKPEDEEKTKKQQDNTINKMYPPQKRFQLSSDKSSLLQNAEKLAKIQASLNSVRKPSKNLVTSGSTFNPVPIGNRPIVTSTHLSKNTPSSPTNGTSSSSTLNLIAALSTSKKFALLSPMEVVQDFVNLVNHAKRNRKTFTICGNFYSLRRAFAERGWIEKMRINIMEDRDTWRKIESLSNFELVDGMRNKEFGEKYRRVFLTKLLAGHQVDFYWDYLTNPFAVNNDKIKRTLINRFPYGATRAYTSKHGLTESLRDAHWYCIEGYANIFYPRTYNLSMIEEMTSFVEDFRITAVISLLQWIVANMTTPEKILSSMGDVPTSVYNFATIQCHNFIKMKEHKDIDEVIPQAKDYEWEVFLEKYYKIVHNENCFKANERISAQLMIEQSKYVLKKVKKYLPNLHLDGFKNMWLLKPNNGSRGSGIHVCRTLKYMMDTVNNRKDIKYVVQKYLERPLLIHKTKFDIRQWFLVTCMPNVKVWLYKECYLRFSSQMFDLNKLHESIHLTNNSIQCRYKNNNQRSTSLPEQNMWDSETFKKYLTEIGQPYAWRNNIYKGMKECLIALFMLCQSKMELRINSFELCGADFMLSEDYHPYLIEINSRPALYASTKITARMCPKVLEDVIKVTVDHARNPKASTGDFELIYTDTFNYSIPRNVNNLYIEGMSYFSKFIETKASIGLNTIVPIQQVKEVKTDSIKKILNIEPDVVKIDVRNTLEKILAVVHNDSNSKIKETPEERNKKFRSMLSEFVNIISTVKNVNEEV